MPAQSEQQKYPIDRMWFLRKLDEQGRSMRSLARFLSKDVSAVSRTLNGTQQMQVKDEARIAVFLGVPVSEVVAHRGSAEVGFAEMQQTQFEQSVNPSSQNVGTKAGAAQRKDSEQAPIRHPAWGALKGMITILPGVDLTEPAFEGWKVLYGEDK